MPYRRLFFDNGKGERLAARLDTPASGDPAAYALFAHCFTCGKDLKAVRHISRALTDAGIAALQFDFTGLGESEGDFADTSFSSNVEDLIAAAMFLERTHAAPKILIGHSLGGAAVLQAAASIPSSVAVVTIGAPADPGYVTRLMQDSKETIEREGAAEVVIAGRPFTIRKSFFDSLEKTRMRETIRNLGRALLICHSPADRSVGIDHAARIFEAAKHPKSFVSLDTADHLLTDRRDSRYVGSLIAAWARRYLEAPGTNRRIRGSGRTQA